MRKPAFLALTLSITLLSLSPGECSKPKPAAAPATNAAFSAGVALYTKKDYRAAAQQFETAMQQSPGNADAIYYCALCQQLSNNRSRAKQLFEYITTSFPQSRVAPMAQTALGQLSSLSSASGSSSASSVSSYASSASSSGAQDPELANVPDQVRVPFEKHGNDVVVTVQVNGHPAQFILDTGAGSVAIGRNHLRDWGINTEVGKKTYDVFGVGDGKAKGWDQRLDLTLGQISRKNFVCGIQENMPTEPLLGQTFLKAFNVRIDDATRMVILAKKGGLGAKDIARKSYNSREVPFVRASSGHMFVDVLVCGKPFKMMFDTGASNTCFSEADWKKLGFPIPDNAQSIVSRGVLGDASSYAFTIDSLKLGPIEQSPAPILVIQNSKAPPLLGMSFYGKLQCTIDTQRNVLIFTEPQ